jgi:hypothetical protein
VLSGLRQNEESAAQVRTDDFVEQIDVILADRRERHDSGVVNNNVNAAEFLHGFIEQPLDIART